MINLTDRKLWNSIWNKEKKKRRNNIFYKYYYKEYDNVLQNILNQLKIEKADILDLGCGSGNLLLRLYKLKPWHCYYGIDYSETAINKAKEKFINTNIYNNLYFGDIFNYNFNKKFDLIISAGLIEHFTNPNSIIERHIYYSKQNGLIAISVPYFSNPFIKFLLKIFNSPILKTHNFNILSINSLYKTLKINNLENIKVYSCMGPRLPIINKNNFSGFVYSIIYKFWNILSVFFPKKLRLWNSTIWSESRNSIP